MLKKYYKIGIIGAMDVEVGGIARAMSEVSEENIGGSVFRSGKINGREVVAVQSGIGKVNAAFAATTLFYLFGVDAVLMTGVCGGIGGGVKGLDAIVPTGFVQHDVSMIGEPDGHIDILNRVVIEPDAELSAALAEGCGGVRGIMATGEQFVDKSEQIEKILAFCPEAVGVDMESAAVAQVCARLGVPFACVKIVSDDGTSGEVYYDFKTAAAEKSVGAVLKILSK